MWEKKKTIQTWNGVERETRTMHFAIDALSDPRGQQGQGAHRKNLKKKKKKSINHLCMHATGLDVYLRMPTLCVCDAILLIEMYTTIERSCLP